MIATTTEQRKRFVITACIWYIVHPTYIHTLSLSFYLFLSVSLPLSICVCVSLNNKCCFPMNITVIMRSCLSHLRFNFCISFPPRFFHLCFHSFTSFHTVRFFSFSISFCSLFCCLFTQMARAHRDERDRERENDNKLNVAHCLMKIACLKRVQSAYK